MEERVGACVISVCVTEGGWGGEVVVEGKGGMLSYAMNNPTLVE